MMEAEPSEGKKDEGSGGGSVRVEETDPKPRNPEPGDGDTTELAVVPRTCKQTNKVDF